MAMSTAGTMARVIIEVILPIGSLIHLKTTPFIHYIYND
jgi:hypothetical protein